MTTPAPSTDTDHDAPSIRRATAVDIPVLVELRLAFDRELAGELSPDRREEHRRGIEEYLVSHLPDGRFAVWVAETARGELVAMAGLVTVGRPPHPRSRRHGEGFVYNVYTVPAWRHRGLATALMSALTAYAREIRLRRLVLRTSDDGRELYDRLGFIDPGNYRQLDLD